MTTHIHIRGPMASGKTTIATAMHDQYERLGKRVLLVTPYNPKKFPLKQDTMNGYDFIIWDDFIQEGITPKYVYSCERQEAW